MPSKYEKEIREILEKMDRQGSSDEDWQRRDRERWKKQKSPRRTPPANVSLSPRTILWIGVGIILLAFFVDMILPIAGPLLALVGIGLFLAGIILSVTGRTGRTEKYWRGMPVKPRKPHGGGLGAWWRDIHRRWFRKG